MSLSLNLSLMVERRVLMKCSITSGSVTPLDSSLPTLQAVNLGKIYCNYLRFKTLSFFLFKLIDGKTDIPRTAFILAGVAFDLTRRFLLVGHATPAILLWDNFLGPQTSDISSLVTIVSFGKTE